MRLGTEELDLQSLVGPVIFCEANFSSGTLRLNTTERSLSFSPDGGQVVTFWGTGHLGNISPWEEQTGLKATGMTLSLSGLDPALMAEVLNGAWHKRQARVWMGFLSTDHRLEKEPLLLCAGLMETVKIELGIESRLKDAQRPRLRRFSDVDHKLYHPGDRFFEKVEETADKDLK